MATLEEVFTRYGYPADEMNEKIWFCFRRADKIETFDRVNTKTAGGDKAKEGAARHDAFRHNIIRKRKL